MQIPFLKALTLVLANPHEAQAQSQELAGTTMLVQKWITPNDVARSRTASMITDLTRALRPLRNQPLQRLLDIGCGFGFGGVTKFIGAYLEIPELHGVDRDDSALEEAR